MADEIYQNYGNFLEDKEILIADSGASSRTTLAAIFAKLGAKTPNIHLAPTYEAAMDLIENRNPTIIVTDYNFEKKCGLNLLYRAREISGSHEQIFILVTSNGNESVVAEAAEEDVDGYILKPYTNDLLFDYISRTLAARINPSDYKVAIDEGKEELVDNDFEDAEKLFERAVELSDKPTLAYFYLGKTHVASSELEEAENYFDQGLALNQLHYRCLVGRFDLFLNQKRHEEAYPVIKKITEFFPLSPARLDQTLRLAIETGNFEDIDYYFSVFSSFDFRPDSLVKVMVAALVVSGKYELQKDQIDSAVALYHKAVLISGHSGRVIREVCKTFCEFQLLDEAESVLKMYPPERRGEQEYQILNFVISNKIDPTGKSIMEGRKMVQDGIQDPLLYETVIESAVIAGHDDFAETVVADAKKIWPDAADQFDRYLFKKAAA